MTDNNRPLINEESLANSDDLVSDFDKSDEDFDKEFKSPYGDLEGNDIDGPDILSDIEPAPALHDTVDNEVEELNTQADPLNDAAEDSVTPQKNISKNSTRKPATNRLFTATTFVLAAGAICLSGFSIYQNMQQDRLTNQLALDLNDINLDVMSQISEFKSLANSLQIKLDDVANGQSIELSNFKSNISNGFSKLEQDVYDVQQLNSSQNTNLNEINSTMVEMQGSINNINEGLKTTTNSLASIRSVSKSRVPLTVNYENSIEGATLESIDRWGTEVFVNLRTKKGGWMSFTEKEKFEGWSITAIKEYQVTFTKNGKQKVLKVKG